MGLWSRGLLKNTLASSRRRVELSTSARRTRPGVLESSNRPPKEPPMLLSTSDSGSKSGHDPF